MRKTPHQTLVLGGFFDHDSSINFELVDDVALRLLSLPDRAIVAVDGVDEA